MAGKADEPNFALLFRFAQGLGRAICPDEQIRIVVERNAVNLPQIQMVGLQSVQRFLQHPHGERLIPPVCADLGHQEDFAATGLDGGAHPVFGLAAMVFPAVVEEIDSRINCAIHKGKGRLLVFGVAQMVAAHAEDQKSARRYDVRKVVAPWLQYLK